MSNHRIKMRMMGLPEDLAAWLDLVHKMEAHQLLKIIEESAPYHNRGDSLQQRIYLEVDLVEPGTPQSIEVTASPTPVTEAPPKIKPASRRRALPGRKQPKK